MASVRTGSSGTAVAGTMLVLAAILAGPSVAHGADASATERAAQAQAACLSGDYTKGVAILAELYVASRNPIYIFNQGRCFEQNGKYEEAIIRFREYQRKTANAGQPSDPVAEQHIADCQALLDKQKPVVPAVPVSHVPLAPAAAPEAPPASTEPPPSPVEAQPATVTSPAQSPTGSLPVGGPASSNTAATRVDLAPLAPAPSEAKPETSILGRWWFWTAVGVAVAGGVTAGLLIARGSGTTTSFCPECDDRAGLDLK